MKGIRIMVVLAVILLLCQVLVACAGQGEDLVYEEVPHTHVYGAWYDAASQGQVAPQQVRYCKICHHEETREKP